MAAFFVLSMNLLLFDLAKHFGIFSQKFPLNYPFKRQRTLTGQKHP